MNPRNQPICCNSGWSVGSCQMKGFACAEPAKIYGDMPNKFGGIGVHKPGDIYGMRFANSDEAHRYMRERGYSHYYCRNSRGFVMSRAARKRGYTTGDWRYNACARRHND